MYVFTYVCVFMYVCMCVCVCVYVCMYVFLVSNPASKTYSRRRISTPFLEDYSLVHTESIESEREITVTGSQHTLNTVHF